MTKIKKYQFICRRCDSIFETTNRRNPLCRFCQQITGVSEALAIEMFGNPVPTPLQAAKWQRALEAIGMERDRQRKIERQAREHQL